MPPKDDESTDENKMLLMPVCMPLTKESPANAPSFSKSDSP